MTKGKAIERDRGGMVVPRGRPLKGTGVAWWYQGEGH